MPYSHKDYIIDLISPFEGRRSVNSPTWLFRERPLGFGQPFGVQACRTVNRHSLTYVAGLDIVFDVFRHTMPKYLRRIHPRCARDQNVLPRSRRGWFAKFPKFPLGPYDP